ncbi:Aste57867_7769 [Aphanomyces stellatus]|uniref:Aste57867_3255 protein n=1 Tax=Aphanomyces stellatus TaxID=120398 RepID=A0A485K9B1_9STRA|nr:hypothetical protein As57867_007739 [Aphanomyces stellatus]KAF0715664.1 hypothetical protein As57867_003245 [Aphanomyces stellatus]VFT80427.1 Aste57867_3255 [Aphanomyces stellatus]VFT84669.1 Aste57867_7769 [Aphanomyces stellatus]
MMNDIGIEFPTLLTTLIATLCLLLTSLLLRSWRVANRLGHIPGPNPLHSIIGHGLDAFASATTWNTTGTFPEPYLTYLKQYGDVFRLREFLTHLVFLNDPKAIQHVLVTNTTNFPRDGIIQSFLNDVMLGVSLLGANGAMHTKYRKLLDPLFASTQINSFLPLFDAQVQHSIDVLCANQSCGTPVDMGQVFQDMTLNVIGLAAFGFKFDQYPQAHAVYKAYQTPPSGLALVGMLFVPPFRDFPLPELVRRRQIQAKMKRVITDVIDAKLVQTSEPRDLLDLLLQHSTTAEAVAHTMTFLTAGHETTSSILASTFALLNDKPTVCQRIRDEYNYVMATYGSLAKWDAVGELKYTLAVIQETMRLHPTIFSIVSRTSLHDDHVPLLDGTVVFIPGGTRISINMAIMHRHPKYWTDPDAFVPDRFVEGSVAWKADLNLRGSKPHAFFYLPFSAGATTCIGHRFALAEMRVILAKLLGNFEFQLTKAANVKPAFNGVTLSPSKLEMTVRAIGRSY